MKIAKGRNWELHWRVRKQFAFFGVHWIHMYSMGYEMDPKHPVKYTKRGTAYQIISLNVWVCLIPCLPFHFRWWR